MIGICNRCNHTKADHGKLGLCPDSIAEKYREETMSERLAALEKKVAVQDKLFDLLVAYMEDQGKMSEELKTHYQATKMMLTGEGLDDQPEIDPRD